MHEVFVPAESTIKIYFKSTRRLQFCENLHFLSPKPNVSSLTWCRFDHECNAIFFQSEDMLNY